MAVLQLCFQIFSKVQIHLKPSRFQNLQKSVVPKYAKIKKKTWNIIWGQETFTEKPAVKRSDKSRCFPCFSIGFSQVFFRFFVHGFAFCLKQQHQKVRKCMGEECQRSKWGTDNLTCRTCRTTSQVWEACHGACHMWDIFQGSFWWQIHPEIAKKVETKHHILMKHVMSHQHSVRRKTERLLRPSFLVFLANLKYRAYRTHKISFQSDAATWVSPRVKAHSHRSAGVANVASGL